jgi:hypothetical protein
MLASIATRTHAATSFMWKSSGISLCDKSITLTGLSQLVAPLGPVLTKPEPSSAAARKPDNTLISLGKHQASPSKPSGHGCPPHKRPLVKPPTDP